MKKQSKNSKPKPDCAPATGSDHGLFSNGGWSVKAMTVGDIIKEISRLPPTMKVEHFPKMGVDLIVFNRGASDEHLGFEEAGFWSDDE